MTFTYSDLGWTAHFARLTDAETSKPLRITAVHRDIVEALGIDGSHRLHVPDGTSTLAPGDWVLVHDGKVNTILQRESLIKRRTAGTGLDEQLIAANVSTLGIVTSCNADFNLARLERYLVLAGDAGCLALIILTKSDQTNDPKVFLNQAQRLSSLATVIAINAKNPLDVEKLQPWVKAGETIALVGSSGVGKSTLRNALTGEAAATQSVREDDAKGRHTTTSRAMVRTLAGGWLIDTPGMRALRLTDSDEGISVVFGDIEELALTCRFSDCAHDTEPGCQIQAAITTGQLDADRYRRWRKLITEEERNSETIAQARGRDKSFGKMIKGAKARKKKRGGP